MSNTTLPAVIPPAHEIENAKEARAEGRMAATQRRAPDFITQLLVQTDAKLRQTIGCQYVVERRVQAYGAALANRPSMQRKAHQSTKVDASS
jgi:hypothetical protein